MVKRPTSCATLGAAIAIRDPARWWYWWYKSSLDFRKTLLLSQELETLLLCNTIPQTGFGLAFGSIRVWPVTSSHTLGINKLWTPYEDRHDDKTSQSFWKAANHVFEAEDLSIILTTKETLKVGLDLMGGSKHYFVSSHPPMLVLAWVLCDVNLILWCYGVTKKTHPSSSCCCPDTLKSPRMGTIHSLLDLVFIFRVFSSLLHASTLVSWGYAKWDHTRCVDWDQPNWQSVMLVSSKLGNESRMYKIIVLKHRFLDIFNCRIHHRVYV